MLISVFSLSYVKGQFHSYYQMLTEKKNVPVYIFDGLFARQGGSKFLCQYKAEILYLYYKR